MKAAGGSASHWSGATLFANLSVRRPSLHASILLTSPIIVIEQLGIMSLQDRNAKLVFIAEANYSYSCPQGFNIETT